MNTANNLIHMGNEIIAIGERMRSVISADPANAIEIGNANNPNPVQNTATGEVPATLQTTVSQQAVVPTPLPTPPVATMSSPEFIMELSKLFPTHGDKINPTLAEFGYNTAHEIQDDPTRLAVIAKIKGVAQ